MSMNGDHGGRTWEAYRAQPVWSMIPVTMGRVLRATTPPSSVMKHYVLMAPAQCQLTERNNGHQENPESAWMELEVLPLEKIAWGSAILFEVHEIASAVDVHGCS